MAAIEWLQGLCRKIAQYLSVEDTKIVPGAGKRVVPEMTVYPKELAQLQRVMAVGSVI